MKENNTISLCLIFFKFYALDTLLNLSPGATKNRF